MNSQGQIAAILDTLRSTPSILITSHARPDGDAVGSVLALASVLDAMGVRADAVLADPIPYVYRSLPGAHRIQQTADVGAIATADQPCLLLECDSTQRSGLRGLDGRFLINIDHHASGHAFADLNWIDPDACAVGAMVYDLAIAAGVEITPEIATCLYAAVLSDTGCFTYSGTRAETFALAHDLATRGAVPGDIAREVYFSNRESKMRLLGTALSNLQRSGPLVWSWVTQEEMLRAEAETEDCEGIVNYLVSIAGVESVVFLRELPDSDQFRLSLRSKGGIDVARIAEIFDGGGHRTASGCTLDGPLSSATERILAELRTGLC